MSWRLAGSLIELRDQIDSAFPNRDKKSDGSIGDDRHQAEPTSDHNPNLAGVVCAIDVTNDPANIPGQELANALVASRDPRIKYLIWNRKIISSKVSPWVWRPYKGANPHQHHVHISVMADPKLYDDAKPWNLHFVDANNSLHSDTSESPRGILQLGSQGPDVRELQTSLHISADGNFGPQTEKAVKNFQYANGLRVDGKVGKNTRAALGLKD